MKFKNLRESFLLEAMSKPMTMRDVKAIEKKYNQKMDQEEIDDYLENNFNPGNSARPDAWLSLGYPVRNGDYYFALIGKRKGRNIKDNQKMNDQLKKMKSLYDDPDALYDNFMDWCYENVKDSGVGDTMTREEIWAACLHIMKKRVATVYVDEDVSVDEAFFKRLFRKLKRGIRKLKPKGVPKESVEEATKDEKLIQKAVKIAMSMGGNMTGAYKKIERMKRGLGDHPVVMNALRLANESVNENVLAEMEMKQIRKKHNVALRKAVRTGNLELPQDAEEALFQWAFDNNEIKTDDPDDFNDWLDNNLDDIIRGKLD
mgnify:CR=1 FL=1|tara:strand:- start:668 stop:1615 length:948 start_codon:yes stop_codon:yes gene_type:complete